MAKKNEQATLRQHEAALRQAEKELPPLCAAVGPEPFLRARAVMAFRNAWLKNHENGDTVTLRGVGEANPVRLPDIVREFSGGSLFSKDKLVLVRQAERILFSTSSNAESETSGTSQAKPGQWEKSFLERIDNPPSDSWLFLETASLPGNRVLGKRLAATVFIIPCPSPTARELPVFLRDQAAEQGRGLEDEAADLLVRAHGSDVGRLMTEIEKLSLFAPEGGVIDADMVRQFLTGSIEYEIFAFTNAVEARNAREAVLYSRRITSQGARDQKGKREDGEKTAHKVLIILAGTIAQLLRAKVAMSSGSGATEFSRDEKLSPWRAEKLFESARRFSMPELRRMTTYMADQVRRAHDTGGNVQLAVEQIAVMLTAPGA